MNAVPNFRRLVVSTGAIARITGVVGIASLGACAVMSDEPPIEMTYSNAPLTVAEVPEVDWDGAKSVHWLLADYVFSPDKPTFTAGKAYRLVIRNTGEGTHIVDAENFFNAVAVKSVEMSAFAGHTGDDHVDEALGPKGLDGVPSVPEIDDGEVMASESAEAASDPFADKPEDAEANKDEDTDDAANPFAAKPDDDGDKDVADDGDKDVADDDNKDVADDDNKDVADDDDKDVAEKDDDSDDAPDGTSTEGTSPEGTSKVLDWKLMRVAEVSVEPGHETTIEFIAVRPGHYSLSSGDWLATIRGMFTVASIVAPEPETKTAAVSE